MHMFILLVYYLFVGGWDGSTGNKRKVAYTPGHIFAMSVVCDEPINTSHKNNLEILRRMYVDYLNASCQTPVAIRSSSKELEQGSRRGFHLSSPDSITDLTVSLLRINETSLLRMNVH